jgi:predicted DNA-binding protein YlxM (UPF0122 family)
MDRFEACRLLDFYGPLLTPSRQSVLKLYLEEDLSLGEIAQETGITRQGVHDALQKAQRQLRGYEEKLGLVARYRRIRKEVQGCRTQLAQVRVQPGSEAPLEKVVQALDRIEQTA